jgi:hypothetical protein
MRRPAGTSGVIIAFSPLGPPSKTGWRRGEKKAARQIEGAYLDWALADFSGYIAADELYDGPFCILSIVDNRTFKRLCYQVLDHDPTHDDIRAFFRKFQAILQQRGLTLHGITTDASPLYPVPIAEVFGDVRHQLCEFHILADLTKAILHVLAQERKKIAARQPQLPRGRPSKATKRLAQKRKRLQEKVGALFDGRYLFVRHYLTVAERKTLMRITRGLPSLRAVRDIMDEVYRLFDRRCRTDTAMAKLAQLRQRVARFKKVGALLSKLRSPNLEKALTFLDDDLLPATSNAVERGNRRYRKMQKTVYRVRTQDHISERLALDMVRECQKPDRSETVDTLHESRAA